MESVNASVRSKDIHSIKIIELTFIILIVFSVIFRITNELYDYSDSIKRHYLMVKRILMKIKKIKRQKNEELIKYTTEKIHGELSLLGITTIYSNYNTPFPGVQNATPTIETITASTSSSSTSIHPVYGIPPNNNNLLNTTNLVNNNNSSCLATNINSNINTNTNINTTNNTNSYSNNNIMGMAQLTLSLPPPPVSTPPPSSLSPTSGETLEPTFIPPVFPSIISPVTTTLTTPTDNSLNNNSPSFTSSFSSSSSSSFQSKPHEISTTATATTTTATTTTTTNPFSPLQNMNSPIFEVKPILSYPIIIVTLPNNSVLPYSPKISMDVYFKSGNITSPSAQLCRLRSSSTFDFHFLVPLTPPNYSTKKYLKSRRRKSSSRKNHKSTSTITTSTSSSTTTTTTNTTTNTTNKAITTTTPFNSEESNLAKETKTFSSSNTTITTTSIEPASSTLSNTESPHLRSIQTSSLISTSEFIPTTSSSLLTLPSSTSSLSSSPSHSQLISPSNSPTTLQPQPQQPPSLINNPLSNSNSFSSYTPDSLSSSSSSSSPQNLSLSSNFLMNNTPSELASSPISNSLNFTSNSDLASFLKHSNDETIYSMAKAIFHSHGHDFFPPSDALTVTSNTNAATTTTQDSSLSGSPTYETLNLNGLGNNTTTKTSSEAMAEDEIHLNHVLNRHSLVLREKGGGGSLYSSLPLFSLSNTSSSSTTESLLMNLCHLKNQQQEISKNNHCCFDSHTRQTTASSTSPFPITRPTPLPNEPMIMEANNTLSAKDTNPLDSNHSTFCTSSSSSSIKPETLHLDEQINQIYSNLKQIQNQEMVLSHFINHTFTPSSTTTTTNHMNSNDSASVAKTNVEKVRFENGNGYTSCIDDEADDGCCHSHQDKYELTNHAFWWQTEEVAME